MKNAVVKLLSGLKRKKKLPENSSDTLQTIMIIPRETLADSLPSQK